MTNIFKFGAIALAAVAVASCGTDPKDPIDPIKTNKVITSNITSNTTWYADTVYQLGGRITVTSGATLTIQPGTVIKGEAGTGSNATALLVARGGKLMAEGTASLPIIFTSVADEITPEMVAAGNFASPNLDPTVNGLWGGLIVLGNAKISPKPGTAGELLEVQIEGIPTSDPNGLYGGNNDADNSGSIKYVSLRHGGTNIGSGNEINGMTFGGVGSGTVVENIEIVANQDDGVEWFGGTVSAKNVVVWNAGDDGLDTDQSWAGTCDNFSRNHDFLKLEVILTFEYDGSEHSRVTGIDHHSSDLLGLKRKVGHTHHVGARSRFEAKVAVKICHSRHGRTLNLHCGAYDALSRATVDDGTADVGCLSRSRKRETKSQNIG